MYLYWLPAVESQLWSLTVFVRQLLEKPSSPLRWAGNTRILQVSYQVDGVDGVNTGQCDKIVNVRSWKFVSFFAF